MYKFSLFTKSDKFYWSTNVVFLVIVGSCLGIILIKQEILKIETNSFEKVMGWILFLTFLCVMYLTIKGYKQIKPLRGKLDGFLVFNENNIQAKDEIFPIENIRKIQISNDDYSGRPDNNYGRHLGPALSNGTNNYIIIYFTDGTNKKYWFEQVNSDDFQKMRSLLIDYHCKGKIDFWELANVLGEKKTAEISGLKEEIEKSDYYLYRNEPGNFR